ANERLELEERRTEAVARARRDRAEHVGQRGDIVELGDRSHRGLALGVGLERALVRRDRALREVRPFGDERRRERALLSASAPRGEGGDDFFVTLAEPRRLDAERARERR